MKSLYTMFLAAFTAVAVLSGSLIGLISYFESEAVLKSQFSASLADGAGTVRNIISERVATAAGIVRDISQRDFVINANLARIGPYIENAVELSNYFYSIYYFSPEGKLSAAAYYDKRDAKPYIGLDYNAFREDENMRNFHASMLGAIEKKAPVFSGFFYTSAKKLLFTYIVPVVRDGRVGGVISAAIYASDSNFQNFMNALRSHPEMFIRLYDPEKRLLAATDAPPAGASDPLASIEAGKVSWLEGDGAGEPCLAFGCRDGGTGIFIAVAIRARAVRSTLADLRGKIISYAIICMAGVVLVSFVFAARLVRPVKSLVDGLREVGSGVYSRRIDENGAGEIGEAIGAFNRMSEKLYKTKVIENIWNERWND